MESRSTENVVGAAGGDGRGRARQAIEVVAVPCVAAVLTSLQREFPELRVRQTSTRGDEVCSVDRATWGNPALDFWWFDGSIEQAVLGGADTLALVGEGWDEREVLRAVTRCQRLTMTRNAGSCGPAFERVLGAHAALYDVQKPLVLADYRHALDTWQWVLRLDREASVAVQIAALFHDIERLVSEPDVRVEQHASDYRAYKERHASAGAAMVHEALRTAGCGDEVVAAAAALVGRHETPDESSELALLNDADALSFFSLNSAGFIDYYGPVHTRKKIVYTLGRMRPATLPLLHSVRLRSEVDVLLAAVLRDRSYGSAA